jgi:hypothetical protein
MPAVGISRASGQSVVSKAKDPFCRDEAIHEP